MKRNVELRGIPLRLGPYDNLPGRMLPFIVSVSFVAKRLQHQRRSGLLLVTCPVFAAAPELDVFSNPA